MRSSCPNDTIKYLEKRLLPPSRSFENAQRFTTSIHASTPTSYILSPHTPSSPSSKQVSQIGDDQYPQRNIQKKCQFHTHTHTHIHTHTHTQ